MRSNLEVSDRAYRYRANRLPPRGPRVCSRCGSRRNVEVDHVNGHEEDNSTRNKRWLCRACNTELGYAMKRAGKGRRTRQYNPKSKPSDPFERFADLQKQGFMKPAKRKPTVMYRAMTPHGATYTGPNRDIAQSHVRQYGGKVEAFRENPKPKGAVNLTQWVLAVMSMHGQSNAMSKRDAIDMVHATPQHKRDEYNREIWNRRRERGTDKTGEVPF